MTTVSTYAQAVANIKYITNTYVPTSNLYGKLEVKLELFDLELQSHIDAWGHEGSIEYAYGQFIDMIVFDAWRYEDAFAPYDADWRQEETVPAHAIVDYFCPTLSPADRAAVIEQMESGAIGNKDFVKGWAYTVSSTEPAPSAASILDAVVEYTDSAPALPEADLFFPGLSDAQVDALVGMYVGAFGRAPEHDGLEYWATEAARIAAEGGDPLREVGARFYDAGHGNGEGGTELNDKGYIDYAYQNVFGREAEAAGADYWLGRLEAGLSRGSFIAEFTAAGQNADRVYLDARIDVATYAAQKHIWAGGENVSIDFFVDVIEGVSNPDNAYSAIRKIIDNYGAAVGQKAVFLMEIAPEVNMLEMAFAVPTQDYAPQADGFSPYDDGSTVTDGGSAVLVGVSQYVDDLAAN